MTQIKRILRELQIVAVQMKIKCTLCFTTDKRKVHKEMHKRDNGASK